MQTIETILQFVIVMGVVIIFHELGHAFAARSLGIPVEEFGLGLPPRLVKLFTYKGTEVTLNAIPFGGFVRPRGEGDDTVEGGMAAAPAWKRLIILLAGITMNLLMGYFLLTIMFAAAGKPVENKVIVAEVANGSPAQAAGIQKGDLFVSVAGKSIEGFTDIQNTVKANLDQPIEIDFIRGEQKLSVTLTPRSNPPEGQGALGVGLSNPSEPMSIFEALGAAGENLAAQIKAIVSLPAKLIRGTANPDENRIVGLKGIFDLYSYANELDSASSMTTTLPIYRLSFVAMICIAVGMTNLLPIPGLDGGQALFVLIEMITGKRLPQKTANIINSIFIYLLILLMAYVLIQDFVNPIKLP